MLTLLLSVLLLGAASPQPVTVTASDGAPLACSIVEPDGAVWNATAAGVPFKAIVPVITWTNLQTALAPEGVAKTELVAPLAALTPVARWDQDLLAASQTLAQGTVTTAAATAAAARSPLTQLPSISVPTLLIRGRHDFLFDIDQAETAYRQLAGPKELYLGDLGHVPAPSPAAEQSTYLGLAVK